MNFCVQTIAYACECADCCVLQVCLEEMPQQVKTFQAFQNQDEYGNMLVPSDKMDELKRR